MKCLRFAFALSVFAFSLQTFGQCLFTVSSQSGSIPISNVRGQEFNPGVRGPHGAGDAVTQTTVFLQRFAFTFGGGAAPTTLYIYDHIPSLADAALGIGSLYASVRREGNDYVFNNAELALTTYYAVLNASGPIVSGNPNLYSGGHTLFTVSGAIVRPAIANQAVFQATFSCCPSRVHSLSVGSTDPIPLDGMTLDGAIDADHVSHAARRLACAADATHQELRYSFTDVSKAPKSDVQQAVEWMIDLANPKSVRPGDTMIFFYSGHGSTNTQTAVSQLFITTNRSPADPLFNLDYRIQAGQLASMFSDPSWNGVNKLFVIDTCYSGGFGLKDNAFVHLLTLPKAALIASISWNERCPTLPNGRGVLSSALAEALTIGENGKYPADTDGVPGVSFNELAAYTHAVISLQGTFTGVTRGDDDFFTPGVITGTSVLVTNHTADFDTQSSIAIAPKPTTGITISTIATLPGGAVQFQFTDTPATKFSVLASTNVALPLGSWTLAGSVVEVSPGEFQFTDLEATNSPCRFYRVRSP